MHPNLVIFKNEKEATKWVKEAKHLLQTYGMDVMIVANPNSANPEGCSILFKP